MKIKIEIFKYDKYKKYLYDRLIEDSKVDRGARSKLVAHLNCHTSYLSQVLRGKPHLTLEQAEKLNGFLNHTKIEAKYFILLVERARAGTQSLQNYFDEQLQEIQQSRFDLKSRLAKTEEIPQVVQDKYFSTWYYSAIHMYYSLGKDQSVENVARHFNLPNELVIEAYQFLETSGLIHRNEKGLITPSTVSVHLGRDSDFIRRHHINWRSQALQSVEKNLKDDLHYSSVVVISKKDFDKLKENFIQAIEKGREIIRPSAEEQLAAITIDVFKI